MARHVIIFSARFAEVVREGLKCQTVRPTRKRTVCVLDELDLRAWSGLPYRSKQVKLREVVALSVHAVRITASWMVLDGRRLNPAEANQFARLDGFLNYANLAGWFQEVHGTANFEGVCIRW